MTDGNFHVRLDGAGWVVRQGDREWQYDGKEAALAAAVELAQLFSARDGAPHCVRLQLADGTWSEQPGGGDAFIGQRPA